MKSSDNWSSDFKEEEFREFTILYMYIAQGQEQITRGGVGQNFDRN